MAILIKRCDQIQLKTDSNRTQNVTNHIKHIIVIPILVPNDAKNSAGSWNKPSIGFFGIYNQRYIATQIRIIYRGFANKKIRAAKV